MTYHLLLLRVLVSESQYGSCKAMMSAKRGDTVFKRAWVALRELLIFCCQMRKFCLAAGGECCVSFMIVESWGGRRLGYVLGRFSIGGWVCLQVASGRRKEGEEGS